MTQTMPIAAQSFVIRQVQAEEASRLSELMRDTFVSSYGHSSTPTDVAAFLASNYVVNRQREEIADPDILSLVIASPEDDTWAGFAQLRFAAVPPPEVVLAHPVELGRMYLAPEFHGKGLANSLMRHVVVEAQARGGDGLWLKVWQESSQAQRFYGKHHFRIVGRAVFDIGSDPKLDWLMVRDLATEDTTGFMTVQGDVAVYQPIGDFRFQPLAALITDAITHVRASGLRKLLVDVRGTRGVRPPSVGERLGMARDWAEASQGKVRLVLVAPHDLIDVQRFGVVAAASFGLVGNVFEDRDEAMIWLRDS